MDFKESAPFAALKLHLAAAALAMGNLRDGGLVIIGVSQRGEEWELSGISAEHLLTYDPDVAINQINSFVSPFADVDVVRLEHSGGQFLVFGFGEFRDTPLVCKKNGPAGSNLVEGRFFVRPPGMARTTAIIRAEQMHELLELAAEKRARRILETSRRLGLGEITRPDAERFRDELGGL